MKISLLAEETAGRIRLAQPTAADAERIAEYRAEFASDRMQAAWRPDRIPGLDHLEACADVHDWLGHCRSMKGKVNWYMSVRESDDRIVGFIVLRRRLCFDDDDAEFSSHIGYSIRPGERRKGYGRE